MNNANDAIVDEAMIEIRFRCGHQLRVGRRELPDAPVCDACGDRQLARVFAPAPIVRARGDGPSVEESHGAVP